MKKNSILAFALIGSLALLFTACEKEITNDPLHLVGTPIVFSASTSYDNGVETKAEYSGDLVGTSPKTERIEWRANDPIKIIYGSTASDYTVTGNGSQDGKESHAGISGGSLVWASASPHKFYARYPNTTPGDLTAAGKFSGTIPASQSVNTSNTITVGGITKYQPNTKDYGYMFGFLSLSEPAVSVELPFKPAFTTLEFKLKRKDTEADKKIKTIQVSTADATDGTPLTGAFEFTIPDALTLPASNQITTSATGKTITLDFSGFTGGGVSVPTDNYLDFSVLALPVNQKYVKVVFTYTDNTVKKLSLKDPSGNWYEFIGGKKYIITNESVPGGDVWDYYIDPIDDITTYGHLATTSPLPFDVTSYKVKRGTTTQVPVSWTIEYSANGTSGWTTSDDGKIDVNLLTGGGGSTLTVNNGANVMRDHYSSESTGTNPDEIDGATAILRSAPEIPAAAKDTDGYFDLSKHPVYGANQFGGPQNMETANCYVVQRPGLYKFPLVYGNAIRNGATNTKSYAPSISSPQGHFLSGFVRHDGSAIQGPWITTDNSISVANAIIVWQDGTSNAEGQIIKDADVSVDGNYIKFEVKRQYIRPGNVVIAARNSSGDIVWSWHIWVTEKDLAPKTVKADNGSTTLSMMNYNLGWMDATSATYTKYNNWSIYVRVSQTESGGTYRIFRVRQIGDNIQVDANVGCNTFYQWGRKDPMLPATGENADKAQYSAHNLAWESSRNHHITSGGIQESILHPNWQLVNLNGTEAHYCGLNYGNLWDAELDNGYSLGSYYKRIPIKTVYDPCPPGYVVPYAFAFSGVSKNTGNPLNYAYYNGGGSSSQLYATYSATIGYHFTVPNSDPMDFPFCGARSHSGESTDSVNGSIYDVKTLGYYWTSCPLKFNSDAGASGVKEKQTAKMMIMLDGSYIRPGHEQRKGAAYAIRPVLQTEF